MRVEDLIEKVKIEDMINADVPIKLVRDKGYAVDKRGEWKALTVYTREQTFYDYKAKEGGNIVKWRQYFHGESYEDALRSICGWARVNPDDLFYFQKLAREAAAPIPNAKPSPSVSRSKTDYPCTIVWADGAKTYADEFALSVDCLNRAPDSVLYDKVLSTVKPPMLKALPSTPESWPEIEQLTQPEPITPKVITLEEVLSQLIVPPLNQYPVTIDWPGGPESYKAEIDLLDACLQRAPDFAWYCHFLNLAKPYILERSKKRRG